MKFNVSCEIKIYVGEFEVEAATEAEAEQAVKDEYSLSDFDEHITSWEVDDITATEIV